MRDLSTIRKELSKLKEKREDNTIRYRMKDGSIVALTRKDAQNETFLDWLENNADPNFRDSSGSKCHALTQMVNNTTNEPFIPWAEWQERCSVVPVEFAEAVETNSDVVGWPF